MAWLDFCMFWLGFVYPRSHPGWIGPIGEIGVPVFEWKPTYRYSILLPPDLSSILRHRLVFLSQIVPVRWRDLIFVCFDWVLYALGPIPTYKMTWSYCLAVLFFFLLVCRYRSIQASACSEASEMQHLCMINFRSATANLFCKKELRYIGPFP